MHITILSKLSEGKEVVEKQQRRRIFALQGVETVNMLCRQSKYLRFFQHYRRIMIIVTEVEDK